MISLIQRQVIKHPVITVMLVLLAVVVSIGGASMIFMATGNDTLIDPGEDAYQDNVQLEEWFGGEQIIILFEADSAEELYTVEHMELFRLFHEKADEQSYVHSIIGPYSVFENVLESTESRIDQTIHALEERLDDPQSDDGEQNQEAAETRLQINQLMSQRDLIHLGIPETDDMLHELIFDEDQLRNSFSGLAEGNKDEMAMMTIRFGSDATDEDKSEVIEDLYDVYDEDRYTDMEVIISGKPVLDDDIRSSMQESIQMMLLMSSVFMVVILLLVFRVQWRLLPLVTVMLALLATVGLTGWIGIPITMVSMAVFPILIGLGIDYAIQFHNRYQEEMLKGEDQDEPYSK